MNNLSTLIRKITHITIELGIGGNEAQTIAKVRKDKVIDPQILLGSTYMGELLVLGQEGTVETCRNSVEKEFPENSVGTVWGLSDRPEAFSNRPVTAFGDRYFIAQWMKRIAYQPRSPRQP